MAETIYNKDPKQNGLPIKYSRKRSNYTLDPFVAKKKIQNTIGLSSSHYTSSKGVFIGSKVLNSKHGSYIGYLRRLTSSHIRSKGGKTGIIKGCKCGDEPEETNQSTKVTYSESKGLNVGDIVYAQKSVLGYYEKATIKSKNDDTSYEVTFESDSSTATKDLSELRKYFECPCGTVKNNELYISTPNRLDDCSAYDPNKKEYFAKMRGYYKNICIQ